MAKKMTVEKRRTNFEAREMVFDRLCAERVRSYWERGVRAYAISLLDQFDFSRVGHKTLRDIMLNGAQDWREYSYGGCSLMADRDIAARLCTPSEWRKKRQGQLPPNSRESWLDVQARALHQASLKLVKAMEDTGI